MLHRTSDLLAHLTNYAAVVVGPRAGAVDVRSVQIVGLSSTLATVVVVLGNGSVESEHDRARPTTSATPTSPRRRRTSPRQLVGSSLAAVAVAACRRATTIVDRLCADALGAVRDRVQRRARLRRRHVVDGVGVRRRRDRPRRAAHARAAVRRRVAVGDLVAARAVGGDRRRARRRAAVGVLGRRRARSSSTASSAARSACSGRPG